MDHLNLLDDSDDLDELIVYVAAGNEWIATRVADTTPAPVRLATLELIRHLWDSQRGPQSTPLSGDDIVTASGVGYAVPNRVLELLGPYRRKAKPTFSFPDAQPWPDQAGRRWWRD